MTQRIEKSGFADIGQAYETTGKTHLYYILKKCVKLQKSRNAATRSGKTSGNFITEPG